MNDLQDNVPTILARNPNRVLLINSNYSLSKLVGTLVLPVGFGIEYTLVGNLGDWS